MHLRIILRNILSNWLGYVVSVALGFIMSPFVVHKLGNTGYGVWTLVLSLAGYFGMLDLGIRSSVGRFVSRYISLNDDREVNRTLSTAVAMMAAAGLAALAGTAVLYQVFDRFKVDPEIVVSARMALAIAGMNVAIALPLSVFGAVLLSLERFDVITGITVASALTRSGLVFLFLKNGHSLVALASVTLLMGIAEYSTIIIAAKLLYRPMRIRWRLANRETARSLLGFGIYRFIWIVANQLIFYTGAVVIGMFLNAAAIAYFAIGSSLIGYGRSVVSLAVDTLFPSAVRLDSRNDTAGLRELLVFGTRIGLLIGIPICVGFLFMGGQFIGLWMGTGYEISAVVLTILTISQLSSLSQYASSLILAGMARHKTLAYMALAEGVINLVLSVILVQRIGIIGVAWGIVIPHTINTAIVIPLYTLRTLGMSPRRYFADAYGRPLACGIPAVIAAYVLSVLVARPGWLLFAAEAGAVCAVFGAAAFFVCLTSRQQAIAIGKVYGLFQRGTVVHEA